MKILVIGNGSTGVHKKTGEHFITDNTGMFLKHLDKYAETIFFQFESEYNKNSNILNFNLNTNNVSSKTFGGKINPFSHFRMIKLILSVDYVYLFYPGTLSRLVGVISIFLKKPFGIYIRGQYYNQNKLDQFILKKANFILTVSQSFVADVLKFCPKVEVIRPMISITPNDLKLDREYKVEKKLNLLFVGRLEERKGIFELIGIANGLKLKGLDFKLNIVGGGDIFTTINDEIAKLDLGQNIILHGLISDKTQLKAFYDDADIFVFTSHDEGFPRVLYEAMASALPIFTTFVGGIPDKMKHLDNCIEIPVRNATEAARLIDKYLKNEKMLRKIGENGQLILDQVINNSLLSHEDLVFKNINIK